MKQHLLTGDESYAGKTGSLVPAEIDPLMKAWLCLRTCGEA